MSCNIGSCVSVSSFAGKAAIYIGSQYLVIIRHQNVRILSTEVKKVWAHFVTNRWQALLRNSSCRVFQILSHGVLGLPSQPTAIYNMLEIVILEYIWYFYW